MKMEQRDCSETPAYKIQTPGNYPEGNYNKISHVRSSRPQSKSIVSCDPPCRNSIEIRREDSVLVDVNVSSAGEYVDMSRNTAAFRYTEVTESAISDVYRL
jgi:hypothetical protein